MDEPRCALCGSTRGLRADGPSRWICSYRPNCEHRVLVVNARLARQVEAVMGELCPACGHRPEDHLITGRGMEGDILGMLFRYYVCPQDGDDL